jgi:hypothetical protein
LTLGIQLSFSFGGKCYFCENKFVSIMLSRHTAIQQPKTSTFRTVFAQVTKSLAFFLLWMLLPQVSLWANNDASTVNSIAITNKRYNEAAHSNSAVNNPEFGRLQFWTSWKSGGAISLWVNQVYVGQVVKPYEQGPECGATGCVVVYLKRGVHQVEAYDQAGNSWNYTYEMRPAAATNCWLSELTCGSGCQTLADSARAAGNRANNSSPSSQAIQPRNETQAAAMADFYVIHQNHIGNLTVSRPTRVNGKVLGNVWVEPGVELVVQDKILGNVTVGPRSRLTVGDKVLGNVDIEPGGQALIYGKLLGNLTLQRDAYCRIAGKHLGNVRNYGGILE